MITALRAFGWEFLRRRRWGFVAVGGYLLLLIFLPIDVQHSERFAFTVITPMTACVLYFVVIFSFGFAGDLAGRESLYPTRYFTLPLPTRALVAPPMLYGMACVALLWALTARFALQPAGLYAPLVWPAVFLAVFIGWAQVLMWLPYGLRGLRVVLAALWLMVIDGVGVLALYRKPPTPLMLALLLPQLPISYFVGLYAVTKARQGHVPDWSWSRTAQRSATRGDVRFASAKSAQHWIEFKQHGLTLTGLVAMVLPFELALLFAAGGSSGFAWLVLGLALLTPVFLAACTAATMQSSLTPFVATRPLTDAGIVRAKLEIAMLSTAMTWLIVLTATAWALTLSHTWFAVSGVAHYLAKYIGMPRTIALVLLALAWLFASTWRQLVQSHYIGLTGKSWLMKAWVFAVLMLLVAFVPVLDWILGSKQVEARVWHELRWILGALVLLKLSAAAWIALRLDRVGAVSSRVLVAGAATWTGCVLALHLLLLWLVDTPHVPAYLTLLIAILAVPLARVGASPLALAWNRHQ